MTDPNPEKLQPGELVAVDFASVSLARR